MPCVQHIVFIQAAEFDESWQTYKLVGVDAHINFQFIVHIINVLILANQFFIIREPWKTNLES